MNRQTKIVAGVGVAVGSLILVAVVLLAVLIGTLNQQAADDAYRECMSELGVAGGPVTDVDEMIEAAEFCSR